MSTSFKKAKDNTKNRCQTICTPWSEAIIPLEALSIFMAWILHKLQVYLLLSAPLLAL